MRGKMIDSGIAERKSYNIHDKPKIHNVPEKVLTKSEEGKGQQKISSIHLHE